MIQLVVNSILLREIDDRKLINAYAHLFYDDERDTTDDVKIKENLSNLLNWDINGDNGLGVYCGKFEQIKRKDWERLVEFIKENHHEIRTLALESVKKRKLESIKVVNSVLEAREKHKKARFTDINYKVSGRGKKDKPCIYKGKEYKSRQECAYKEQLTRNQLYRYLKETNQL